MKDSGVSPNLNFSYLSHSVKKGRLSTYTFKLKNFEIAKPMFFSHQKNIDCGSISVHAVCAYTRNLDNQSFICRTAMSKWEKQER